MGTISCRDKSILRDDAHMPLVRNDVVTEFTIHSLSTSVSPEFPKNCPQSHRADKCKAAMRHVQVQQALNVCVPISR